MNGKQVAQCPICGEPYFYYPYSAAYQGVCSDCFQKAKDKEDGKWEQTQATVGDIQKMLGIE